ncbi:hypothetical protein T484DRAFT_2763940 [Baffinella frigidus]|nr:hypothetical protein T484DRAFT_2763940 [Cryptophyta sp. CCMP2293]
MDEAANRLLQDDIKFRRAKLASEEVGQAASKLEADSLREELVELKAELKKFNKTRLAARGQPEREQDPSNHGVSSTSPAEDIARCRAMSDVEQEAVSNELDDVLREIEANAADMDSVKMQQNAYLGILVLLALVCLPGVLIFFREAELLDIRGGTMLCSIVSVWEGRYNEVLAATGSAFQFVLNHTACVLLPPPPALAPYRFTVRNPPRMKDGYHQASTTEWALEGEASLKVCARGTSEVSFLRRDDCDGCLCPAGSVWVHYKDPRFVGPGMDTCVPDTAWRDCISSWAVGKYRPNDCWEFIWNGGRQDPEHGDYKVLVDSCSLHGGCYFMIKRLRRWELLSDTLPALHCDTSFKTIGVDRKDIEKANATLNIIPSVRGWGFPSSVQTLLRLGPSSDPEEWKESHVAEIAEAYSIGRRNKIWQVVSRYSIQAYDYHGNASEVASWLQREHRSFVDA